MTLRGGDGPFGFETFNEQVEAKRLSHAVDALEAGGSPDLDPREDPELASLIRTTEAFRLTVGGAQPASRYKARSKAMLQLTMVRQFGSDRGRQAVVERRRWWASPWALSPVAAAVALVIAVAAVGGVQRAPQSGDPAQVQAPSGLSPDDLPPLALSPPIVSAAPDLGDAPNLTSLSVDTQLSAMRLAFEALDARTRNGDAVEAATLRELAAQATSVARRIESEPETVPQDRVVTYISNAADARSSLSGATAEPGAEAALAIAQAATQDAVVVASRYLAEATVVVPTGTE